MKTIKTLLLLVAFFCLASCASIILGGKQSVGISSNPSNAKIFVNDVEMGTTPQSVRIKKSDAKSFVVRIELDGYTPYETILTRKTSGWIAGNILFGGLIGLAIDYATGSAYVLTPKQVEAELGNQTSMLQKMDDTIHFFVTLEPKEDWTAIGRLSPAN